MKTIEELAKEFGVLSLHEQSLEGDVYVIGNVSLTNLEKLCKAYMQDRLSELKPVAWIYKDDDTFDGEKWNPKKMLR